MLSEIHTFVEHSADFDDAIGPCSVKQEVPWAFNPADMGGNAIATMSQMISAGRRSDFRSTATAGQVRICRDIDDRSN